MDPVKTLELMATVGPTRAAKALGVSTTTLHKARRTMEVSKIVEVAASGLLKQPAPVQRAAEAHMEMKSFAPSPAAQRRHQEEMMFVISVAADKAPVVRRFMEMLDAEIISA